MTDNQPSAITGSDATDRLIAVYEQLGHTRQDATRLAINLLGAYGREYQREYRPHVLREAADALEEAVNEMRREDQSRVPYRVNSLGAGMVHAIGRLRRMADEAETPST